MIDPSALKESSCLRRLYLTVVEGYSSKVQTNDVEFGSAFHKFKAYLRIHGINSFAEAHNAAIEYYKVTPMYKKKDKEYLTEAFLSNLCREYYVKYLKDDFEIVRIGNESLVELPFCFPYYSDDKMDILLCGTIDEIGKIKKGLYCISDLKTTHAWDIESYFRGYKLSPQLIFYVWALRKYYSLYREKFPKDFDIESVGVFIDGVFLRGKNSPVELVRSEVEIIKLNKIIEFEVLLSEKINELIKWFSIFKVTTPNFPLREGMLNGSCQTIYGPCKFFNVCASPDNEVAQILLQNNYKQKHYNPLKFGQNDKS